MIWGNSFQEKHSYCKLLFREKNHRKQQPSECTERVVDSYSLERLTTGRALRGLENIDRLYGLGASSKSIILTVGIYQLHTWYTVSLAIAGQCARPFALVAEEKTKYIYKIQ